MLSSGYFRELPPNDGSDYIILLIIDPQNDYHIDNPLMVPGALEDSVRITDMIKRACKYREHKIDEVIVTMDSHHGNHISFASFWKSVAKDGVDDVVQRNGMVISEPKRRLPGQRQMHQPKPLTTITVEDMDNGIWMPVDKSLLAHCRAYLDALSRKGLALTIWPEHCLIGTPGHAVVENIFGALQEWSDEFLQPIKYIFKGTNQMREMYSAIQAEVPLETDPLTEKHQELLDHFYRATKLIVCGQALNHCVKFTIEDILEDWNLRSKAASDMTFLYDGCSAEEGKDEEGLRFVRWLKSVDVTLASCAEMFP